MESTEEKHTITKQINQIQMFNVNIYRPIQLNQIYDFTEPKFKLILHQKYRISQSQKYIKLFK